MKRLNRRDFLKGLGLLGGGALVSLVERRNARANPSRPAIPNPVAPGPPPLVDTFVLEVSGLLTLTFDSVVGLGSQSEVITYQDGNDIVLRHRPGRTEYANILLERQLTNALDMWAWQSQVGTGSYRHNGSILAYDSSANLIASWNFTNGWPCEVYAVLSRTETAPYTPIMRERTVLAVSSIYRVVN